MSYTRMPNKMIAATANRIDAHFIPLVILARIFGPLEPLQRHDRPPPQVWDIEFPLGAKVRHEDAALSRPPSARRYLSVYSLLQPA
jgi:hypothetical protein